MCVQSVVTNNSSIYLFLSVFWINYCIFWTCSLSCSNHQTDISPFFFTHVKRNLSFTNKKKLGIIIHLTTHNSDKNIVYKRIFVQQMRDKKSNTLYVILSEWEYRAGFAEIKVLFAILLPEGCRLYDLKVNRRFAELLWMCSSNRRFVFAS